MPPEETLEAASHTSLSGSKILLGSHLLLVTPLAREEQVTAVVVAAVAVAAKVV